MNINLYKQVHATTHVVHVYTNEGKELPVKDQRGKLYVHYGGRQVNVKDIGLRENDPVFNYIFEGGFQTHRCPAMDYWIYRHRLKNRISTKDYAKKFNVKRKRL